MHADMLMVLLRLDESWFKYLRWGIKVKFRLCGV